MPKVGDIVLYKVQNKVYNAIVLHVHQGQPDYLGKNGEPQLHLAFIAPDRETAITKNKFGYIPQIFYDYDVVHASHEFSADFKKDQGVKTEAEIKTRRGQGEWVGGSPNAAEDEVARTGIQAQQEIAASPAPPLHDLHEPTEIRH